MSIGDHDDVRTGGYVHGQAYLTMRLRMLLTGTAAPDETTWADALKRLLAHIATHPVPGTPDDRAKEFAAAWGVRIAEPAAAQDERGEREIDAGHEIRMLDLDDDLIVLVQGSDTPIVNRMVGRVMDTAAPVPGSFVLLAGRGIHDYDFAMDALIRFEDEDGSSQIALTLFGTRSGSNYDWKWADLSRRTPTTPENAEETRRIAGILHVVDGSRIRDLADAGASDLIESHSSVEGGMSIGQIVRPENVVLTGDDDNVAFVMPVRLHIAASNRTREVDVVHQGRVVRGSGFNGSLQLASVTLAI